MADEPEKKDLADGSKSAASEIPPPKLGDHDLLPPREAKQSVPLSAIPVVSIDDLLKPSEDSLPPAKILPPISVMPHPPEPPPATTPNNSAPQKTAATSAPAQPKAPPTPPPPPQHPASIAPLPLPAQPEQFVRRTTQPIPIPVIQDEPTPTPIVTPPILAKTIPVPPPPIIPVQPAPRPTLATTASKDESPVMPLPTMPTPTPVTPTENIDPQKKSWGPFKDNISSILNAIKLPERFDAKASGDRKIQPGQTAPEPTIISETVRPGNKPPAAPMPPSVSKIAPPPAPPIAPIQQTPPTPATALPNQYRETVPTPAPQMPKTVPPVTPPPAPPSFVIKPPAPAPISGTDDAASKDEPGTPSMVTPLRTFKEDLMHVVQDRKISMVSAFAMEADKKRDANQPTQGQIDAANQRRRHALTIIFSVAILLGLSVAALFGIYTVQTQRATPLPNPNNTSIIFAEQTFSFPLQDLTASDIKRTLSQSRGSSNASLGSITRIVPTVQTPEGGARAATTEEFFKALDLHVSDDLVRALGSEFFLGIHTIDKNSILLIIPVTSYERAFAAMLAWEPAMNSDLAPAFTQVPEFSTGANGLPLRRTFEDVVMRNYDARILKDDSNTVQLYYSFPTPNILIISENTFSFAEILSRLQAQRRL